MQSSIRQHPFISGILGVFVGVSVFLALLYGSVRALRYFLDGAVDQDALWWIRLAVVTACGAIGFITGSIAGNRLRYKK